MLPDQIQISMKRYYEALDIPQSATVDEIRAQYKQLVRVYHPDRFADVEAKAQAEERFKAINEAYRALTEVAEQRGKQLSSPKPKPVVDRDLLDFGVLQRGEKRTLAFQANNIGEPTVNVNYRFSSTAPWFKVAEIHPLQPDQPIPLIFKIETTLEELTDSGDYSGLIEINMDGQIAFVHLGMKLAERRNGWQSPSLRLSYLVVGLLLFIGVASFALFSNFVPQVVGIPAMRSAAAKVDKPALTVALVTPTAGNGAAMPAPKPEVAAKSETASQWSPIFSPDGSQIAFISNELGEPQVYLRDPQSGKLRQLTQTSEQKANLAWSPDSLKLAYIGGEHEQAKIYIIDIKENQVQELAPVALPGVIKHLIWAEDSQSVIFDYHMGQEQRFYQTDFSQKESVLFTPPAGWDTSWANSSE
jgi:DnaJ domain/WD40-like Beta Propeller Repeat